LFWIDGDGKKQDILANTITKEFVNLHEVLGNARSYPTARCIEKLYGNNSILDQITVETIFPAQVVDEKSIREFVGITAL